MPKNDKKTKLFYYRKAAEKTLKKFGFLVSLRSLRLRGEKGFRL